MVGVPRSSGCHLCVKRRVKCDQQPGACGNCIKYGAECPGYDRSFKFVAGKHAVRPRRRGPPTAEFVPSSASSSAFAASSPASSKSGSYSGEVVAWDSSSYWARDAASYLKSVVPRENRAQFICTMIETLNDNPQREELMVFNTWLTHVPAHLGIKITLDSAMATFALHLLGKTNNDNRLVCESRSIYSQSLVALQAALNHPAEWKSPETLASAMILCMFELFAGTTNTDSWMTHAAGVIWLIQQRGPEAHKKPWDKDMLLSFRGMIVMYDLFTLRDCFLAKKRWHGVMQSDRDFTGPHSELERIVEEYLAILVQVPSILKYAYMMREALKHGMPIDTTKVPLLMHGAAKLLGDVRGTFARFSDRVPAPVDVPPEDPGSVFETVLSFENSWHGGLFMSFWATMCILQECLNVCGYPESYKQSNKDLARNIFRSVETVGAGFGGPYRVGYPVRIAYEFADTRTQVWLLAILSTYEKTYAATSPETYERPGQNQYGDN